MKTDLGGDRIGSGGKMTVDMHGFDRSTFNLNRKFKTSMAPGTLVPFFKRLATRGTKQKIHLDLDAMTLPTVGPLFGEYEIQAHVFSAPLRLYQGKLHMNKVDIGRKMETVHLPVARLEALSPLTETNIDNSQINASCSWKYMGLSGLGVSTGEVPSIIKRDVNVIPQLMTAEVYKNYYANKQEEIGAVIHNPLTSNDYDELQKVMFYTGLGESHELIEGNTVGVDTVVLHVSENARLEMEFSGLTSYDPSTLYISVGPVAQNRFVNIEELFGNIVVDTGTNKLIATEIITNGDYLNESDWNIRVGYYWQQEGTISQVPKISTFPLENIDTMRELILMDVQATGPFVIGQENPDSLIEPYSYWFTSRGSGSEIQYSLQSPQEGLFVTTYNSDMFNNWVNTDWIDGDDGLNKIAAVQVDPTTLEFSFDEFMIKRAMYDSLMRTAVSDGSYDSWQDSQWEERSKRTESPVFHGGMHATMLFQEVISNSESADKTQPLGTLAGRGIVPDGTRKGGYIEITLDEASYVMGFVRIVPKILYTQGNEFDLSLKTMDDLHKPIFDQVAFDEAITDRFAWWDTRVNPTTRELTYRSAGKQPAWLPWMTNYDVAFGSFAQENDSQFMVLARKYEPNLEINDNVAECQIQDLTTYIDPTKFNQIFAYTRLDAMNFWMYINIRCEERALRSSKVMPKV